jgi:hypothetical protein
MKIDWLALQPKRGLKERIILLAVALLLVAGLLLASVALPPLAAPVHALHAPAAAASQAPDSKGINGTLASFTALYPNIVTVSLPFILR